MVALHSIISCRELPEWEATAEAGRAVNLDMSGGAGSDGAAAVSVARLHIGRTAEEAYPLGPHDGHVVGRNRVRA